MKRFIMSVPWFAIVALSLALAMRTLNASAFAAAAPATQPDFAQALAPHRWLFPRDHGRHDGFKTEWWYFTGNVHDAGGRKFGFQLTFFRTSMVPRAATRPSAWAMNDLYFAHAAVTDVAGGRFLYADRLARGRKGSAFASNDTLDVVLQDWICRMKDDGVHLLAVDDALGIDLLCKDGRGPVLQGPGGLNAKGTLPGQASYYYSMTRLATTGTLVVKGEHFAVDGMTWMDHEFSSNALAANQAGWDWLALTLADGNDYMIYRMRDKSGATDYLSGARIAPGGSAEFLTASDITLTPAKPWTSPRSGGEYPQQWAVKVKGEPPLLVRTRIADQELQTPHSTDVTYYEGSVDVTGEGNRPAGEGYLEMTGYAKALGGAF